MKDSDNTVDESHEEVAHIEEKKVKKSHKGLIFLGILILLSGIFGWWTQSLPEIKLWKAMPAGAGVVIGTSNVLSSWKTIHDSPWNKAIEESLSENKKEFWDNTLINSSTLHYLLGSYPSMGAIYQTENKGRAKLLVVDLGWKSKLSDQLRFILGKKFSMEVKELENGQSMTVLERRNTHFGAYFIYQNLLVFSTHESLAKRSYQSLLLDGESNGWNIEGFDDNSFGELWLNPDAIYTLSEKNFVEPQMSVKGIGKLLGNQHWVWTEENGNIKAKIEISEEDFKLEPVWWMWSGTSSSKELLHVIPENSSVASHWGMSSKVKERRAALMRANIAPWKVIEDRLSVSIADDFDSWIGDEAAWVKMMPSELSGREGEVMLLKTDNPALASEKLREINIKVEGFTLERFSELKYRGFAIGYIGIEDFLPRIYGDAFDRIKRPYYTVLGNAVAFSNHPKSLKRMIDAKLEQRTLTIDERKLPKSAMYIWGNGMALFEDLPLWIDNDGISKLKNYRPIMESVSSFEMAFLPRAKYDGASFLHLNYGDLEEAKLKFERIKKEQLASDSQKYTAYLDGVEMDQEKAFEVAAPLKSDVDNMIKFNEN